VSTLNNPSKHGSQRSGMTHQAWRKAQTVTRKSAARLLHESWGSVTYNIGRNAAKRERAALIKTRGF
jgi:hypothetical protein